MSFPMRVFLYLALLAGLLSSGVPAQAGQTVRRAAFDIGSANIKCTIADVDRDSGSIVRIVQTMTEKVDFAEDLALSYDSNLSADIMDKGLKVMEKFKNRAVKLQALGYSAVGGASFRNIRNGQAYFVRLENETGVPCRIISDQQAAMIGFHAARQVLNDNSRDLLVWDIGGGNMTMTLRRLDGGLLFHLDHMASVSFKNAVISTIQDKDISKVESPNPMTAKQVEQALAFIKGHATMTVPALIKSRLRHSDMVVAGIGGVHFYSVPALLGNQDKVYTRQELAAALKRWTDRPDKDFNSEFAPTRLTNLILVLGYMDALNMDEIHPLKINLADGLFAAPEFW